MRKTQHKLTNKKKLTRLSTLAFMAIMAGSITSYAHTNDDVRELYGKARIDTEVFHDFINYIDGEQQEITEERIAEIEKTDPELAAKYREKATQSAKDSLWGRVQSISREQGRTALEIKEAIEGGYSLTELSTKVTKLQNLTKSLNDFKDLNFTSYVTGTAKPSMDASSTGSEAVKEKTEEHPIEWYFDPMNIPAIQNEIKYKRTLMNDYYDIGHLCYSSKYYPIKTDNLEIVTGFRGKRMTGSILDSDAITGMYVKSADKSISTDKQRIQSMFSGVVTRVEYSEYYGNWLEVQSGKGLRISYSFLGTVLVEPGNKVNQGDAIATGSTLDGEIYIEAILDEEYVNPAKMLDKHGQEEHNRWFVMNPSYRGDSSKISISPTPSEFIDNAWDKIETGEIGVVDYEEVEPTVEYDEDGNVVEDRTVEAWGEDPNNEDTWNRQN